MVEGPELRERNHDTRSSASSDTLTVMLATLACLILQSNALGKTPNKWESKQYGIQMSYPRSWHAETANKLKQDQKDIDDQDRRDEAEWKKRSGTQHQKAPRQTILFEADADGPAAAQIDVRISVYKSPPLGMPKEMDSWPKSPYTKDIPLHALPTHNSTDEPIDIGGLHGFASLVEYMHSSLGIAHVGSNVEFDFRTPSGDYIRFDGVTESLEPADQFEMNSDPNHPAPPSKAMQSALPIFSSIIRSITFKK